LIRKGMVRLGGGQECTLLWSLLTDVYKYRQVCTVL
jgi:hypothetical protein